MGAGMMELVLTADIRGSAETVFDTIVDLPGYGRWLGSSSAYAGTTEISTTPVTTGTTYVEQSPSGTRHGTVTELDRPAKVTFHQPMTMRPGLLGVLDIHVTYTLTPTPPGIHLTRTVTVAIRGPLRFLRPVLTRQFRAESQRTMDALKAFVES